MIEVVLPEEQIGIPIRLEIGIETAASVIDLVFVRVDELRAGMALNREGDLGEGMRPQHIVMIEQRDIVSGRQLEGRVGGLGYVTIDLTVNDLDAFVLRLPMVESRPDPRCSRGIVGDAEFPVLVNLRPYAFDRLIQYGARRVVDRHQD